MNSKSPYAIAAEATNQFFDKAIVSLRELQSEENRSYNVREVGERMLSKYSDLNELTIQIVAKRVGFLFATRSKKPENNLVKERMTATNDLGGNYRYYLK